MKNPFDIVEIHIKYYYTNISSTFQTNFIVWKNNK